MGIALTIAIGVSGLVLCVGYLVIAYFDRQECEIDSRLREAVRRGSVAPHECGSDPLVPSHVREPRRLSKWWLNCRRLLPDSDSERQRYQSQLIQAGKYGPEGLSEFFAARLACMILPIVIGMVLIYFKLIGRKYGVMLTAASGASGFILPSLWLRHRIARRQSMMRRALPDCLDLMIVCLESGLSVQGTVQRVADEIRIAHPQLADELGVVQRDIELGAPVDVALRNFAERSALDAVRTLSTFVRDARRFGSQLTEVLRTHADLLRYQREQAAEENAQRASIKILFPTVLLILPAVFVVLAGPAAIKIQEAFSR